MQPLTVTTILSLALLIGLIGPIEASKTFQKHDQPELYYAGDQDFGSLLSDNDIEAEEPENCPFSQANQDDNDDWQMIELAHEDPWPQHLPDHLPVLKLIDPTWPVKMMRPSKYLPPARQQWKKTRGLDARKLFLKSKFHYKSKLQPLVPVRTHKQPEFRGETSPRDDANGQLHPSVTMFMGQKPTGGKFDKQDLINELDQQQDLLVQLQKDNQQQPSAAMGDSSKGQTATLDMIELNYVNKSPPYQMSRARESFQAAAELARRLENQPSRGRADDELRRLNLTSSADGWDVETTRADTNGSTLMQSELVPIYLGLGKIYKTDNARSSGQQARLSCSFGLDQEKDRDSDQNVTISEVQWAKFVGNYNLNQIEPSFGCKFVTCQVVGIKNDIWTTVHPRPAVQLYLGDQAKTMPSYSITIHRVDQQQHAGLYRCSAIRQVGDKRELVYRVVPLT